MKCGRSGLLGQVFDPRLDRLTNRADVLDWTVGGIGNVPVLHGGRDVRARAPTREGDSPVGVQLHLDGELLRAAVPEVEPISLIASTTKGHTCRAGCWPADSARRSGGASRRKKASAICERPALCVQTNRTVFNASPLMRRRRACRRTRREARRRPARGRRPRRRRELARSRLGRRRSRARAARTLPAGRRPSACRPSRS